MGVYTIAGGKGGVGKSTTVASIGITLAEVGEAVALVDADLSMANLATIMGVEADRGIHQVLAGEAALDDVTVETERGITLVPGDHGLDLVREADPANMREVIEPLAADHDVVLVDTGAGLDHETLVATGLADGTVLTTTPRREAVADVAKTAEFVEHADAEVLGAVVTRATAETDPAAVAETLGVPLLGVVPEGATGDAEPITEGEAGLAYESLTATLSTECDEGADVAAPAAVDWTPAVTEAGPAETGAGTDAETAPTPTGTAVATDGGAARPEERTDADAGGLFATIRSLFA